MEIDHIYSSTNEMMSVPLSGCGRRLCLILPRLCQSCILIQLLEHDMQPQQWIIILLNACLWCNFPSPTRNAPKNRAQTTVCISAFEVLEQTYYY